MYGEIAARAAAAADARWSRETAREARLLSVEAGAARRGYDFFAPAASNRVKTLRIPQDSLGALADASLVARDGGGRFLDRKARGSTLPDSRRVLGHDEPALPMTRHSRLEAIRSGATQGRKHDIVSLQPLPAPLCSAGDERHGNARKQHFSIMATHNPLNR